MSAEAMAVVFSTQSYQYLRDGICALGGQRRGEVETRQFPDGERYQRLVTPAAGVDAVLVGGTVSEADTLELYDLASGLVESGARSLTLLIPYFGYATMERAVRPQEVVTAKTRARLLSSIPQASAGSRVVLLDLHSEGIPYYFEGPLRPMHLYAKPVILSAIRRLGGSDYVLASTDSGRAKWVESLANDLSVPAAFIIKRRLDGEHTEVAALSAHVESKHVVLYDDMIRTGSSLLGAARAYQGAGASQVSVVATHGIFPEGALTRLEQSGLISRVVCTDSHPRARALAGGFLTVEPLAELFAQLLELP